MCLVPALTRLVVSRLGWVFAAGDDRDAEILALRHQILVLQRQVARPRFTETDRTVLAVLSTVVDRTRLREVFLIVQPATVIGWHRRLVARRWTQPDAIPTGAPRRDHRQPQRGVDHPSRAEPPHGPPRQVPIPGPRRRRDRTDHRPTPRPDGQRLRRTLVRSLRHELLDRTIIWNERQLRRLLDDYIDHHNTHRPHRSLDQHAPDDDAGAVIEPPFGRDVERHSTCAGLINECRTAA